MLESCATRHWLGGTRGVGQPSVMIRWTRHQLGYAGEITFWRDENHKGCTHECYLGQTSPLGGVNLFVDDCGHGCWAMARIEGAGITERDLQWAGEFAVYALRQKHRLDGMTDKNGEPCAPSGDSPG